MGSSSSQSTPPSNAIVSPQFCLPYPVRLIFFKKSSWFKSGRLTVADINGNIIFKVETSSWSLRNRMVILDSSKKPVISLQQKLCTLHDAWEIFMGDRSDSKHLLFTVKRSSLFQFKTKLHVFLASNTKEKECDFKVKGSYGKKSCTVYKGDSSDVVAQMSKVHKGVNSSLPKRAFGVDVIPNMDYCFVTALVVILRHFHEEEKDEQKKAVVEAGVGIAVNLATN